MQVPATNLPAILSTAGAEGPASARQQQQQQSHPAHAVPHPLGQQQHNLASRPQQQHMEPAAQQGAALGLGRPLPAAPDPAACVHPAAVVGLEVAAELIGSLPAPIAAVQFTLEQLAGPLSAGPLPSSFRLALERFLPPQQQQHQGNIPVAAGATAAARLQHGLEELLQTVIGLVKQALTKAVAEEKPQAALMTFQMEMCDITLRCGTELLPMFADCLRAAGVPESDPAFKRRRLLFCAVVSCLRTMVGRSLDDAIYGDSSSRIGFVHAV